MSPAEGISGFGFRGLRGMDAAPEPPRMASRRPLSAVPGSPFA